VKEYNVPPAVVTFVVNHDRDERQHKNYLCFHGFVSSFLLVLLSRFVRFAFHCHKQENPIKVIIGLRKFFSETLFERAKELLTMIECGGKPSRHAFSLSAKCDPVAG
jgi:hypothetical protein